MYCQFSSIQLLSCVDSLRPHGLQHARLPYPSPTPRACWNSCPSSRWCHPTISSSVVPFSCCLQSFPASGSFQMSQFFASGGQSIRVSASASVLPINIQDWFPVPGTKFPSLRIWYLQLENNNYEFASLSMYHIKMTTGGQWENSRNNLPQNISKYMSDGASLSPPPV